MNELRNCKEGRKKERKEGRQKGRNEVTKEGGKMKEGRPV
jgi:hypothetical protein